MCEHRCGLQVHRAESPATLHLSLTRCSAKILQWWKGSPRPGSSKMFSSCSVLQPKGSAGSTEETQGRCPSEALQSLEALPGGWNAQQGGRPGLCASPCSGATAAFSCEGQAGSICSVCPLHTHGICHSQAASQLAGTRWQEAENRGTEREQEEAGLGHRVTGVFQLN